MACTSLVRLDPETGAITGIGGEDAREDLKPIAVLDEDTVIAIHDRRRVVRLRRGSDEMEVLFPR